MQVMWKWPTVLNRSIFEAAGFRGTRDSLLNGMDIVKI